MSQNGKFIIGGRQVENTDGRKALELFQGYGTRHYSRWDGSSF